MPLYEYRCPTCRSVFELLRTIGRSDEPATCPEGHQGAERVLSLVAARAWGTDGASNSEGSAGGCGGCAAGSCACAH